MGATRARRAVPAAQPPAPAAHAIARHLWDLSCKDWAQRLRTGQPLIPELPLNEEEANLAAAFFDQLCLPDVQGKPLLRDTAGQWFRDLVRALFGSWDPDKQIRYIEEIFCLVPKKSSKTTYGAALMMTALMMNKRPRAEFLFVGPTQAISDLAYSQASGMVDANNELKKRFWARDHSKVIEDRLNGSKLKVKTFDLDILTGPRPAGVMLDELHLLGRHHTAVKVLRQLRGGRASTPEGFMIICTTQSDEQPAGAFKEELATARAVRDGKVQGKMLPVLYEFPDEIAKSKTEEWKNPKHWPMVLPNLGLSLDLQRLQDDFAVEQTKGDAAIRLWASQHLNIQIGTTIVDDGWAGAAVWDKRGDKDMTLDDIKERSEVIVAGIDGGGLDDFLSLSLMGRCRDTKHWLHWQHSWVAEGLLAMRPQLAPRLRDFEDLGELTIVESLGTDVNELVGILEEVDGAGLLAMVGLDPAGVGGIVDALADVGIGGPDDDSGEKNRVVGISQGWRLNGAIKSIERKLSDGTFEHCGQKIMQWCVGNAKTEQHGNAVIVTKQASGKSKIDPLMSAFDASALMSGNPQAPKRRKKDVNDFLQNAVVV